jgi:DNA mismatch repair protein MutS
MEQYYREKKQYPDAILLFRVGDFYETFAEDAIVVSRDLNITLTSRQKDDEGNKIPLAGVPYHALDAYLARLIKAGHKVAICDQVEDPKLAKGLVKREITRVVTPGTIIEPSMLEDSSNNFLAAVVQEQENGRSGVAFVDVSTGELLTTEIESDRLKSEMARFRPAECISSSFSSSSSSSSSSNLAHISLDGLKVQELDEPIFSLDNARLALEVQFGPGWAKRFRLADKTLATRACGAILQYLHRSHFDALGHINEIRLYSCSEFMVLDEITLRNLELMRNIRDRSRRGTLFEFLDQTETPMGSRTLAKWIQIPLVSLPEIKRRLDAIDELIKNPVLRTSLGNMLKGAADLERLVGRVSCGAATPKDMMALKSTLERLSGLFEVLKDCGSGSTDGADGIDRSDRADPSHPLYPLHSSYLQDLHSRLDPLPISDVISLVARSVADDPPAHTRDGGIIRSGFDQELDDLRSILKDSKAWISRMESAERQRTGIKSLKVGYTGVFGYYLEVSRANLHLVPENYQRKQTLANAERFITPELKETESKVISAQERSVALEQEIFGRVRLEVAGHARDIQSRAIALGELDVLCSLALVASENSLVKPEFNTEGRIALRDSRHPVLDRAMKGGFVPNDVYLDTGNSRLIILTGPNMAGKSTFMRQIALVVVMAQMGSFVPASFASLAVVDRIFTRVGAYDDLSAGQSTFMVEMTELANILDNAGKDSLVLLDEVGRGTSTFDGLAIAWAITEYLHNVVKGKAIFATHYHQLTQLEGVLAGVKNYNMAVKEEGGSITFLRAVVPGATDKSYGVHVAKLAGIPEAVIKRANEVLREIESETVIDPLAGTKRGSRSSKYTQLIFFDQPGGEPSLKEKKIQAHSDPVAEEILQLDLDSMTPREAHGRLAEYQKRLKERVD